MSGIATAVVAGAVISGTMSSRAQKKAAAAAAGAQKESTEAGIAEQERQFDAVRKLLEPYVNAGTGALSAQQNLIGLGGADAQRSAISQLEQSPQFGALMRRGNRGFLRMLRRLVVSAVATRKAHWRSSGQHSFPVSSSSSMAVLEALPALGRMPRLGLVTLACRPATTSRNFLASKGPLRLAMHWP